MGALSRSGKRCKVPVFGMVLLGLAVPAARSRSPRPPSRGAARQDSAEVAIYNSARSVIDLTRAELLKSYPTEMKNVDFDENSGILNSLLEKIGENVETFFRNFPNTLSKEQVRREFIDRDGKVSDFKTQDFIYSVYSEKNGAWQETRTDTRGREIKAEQMSRTSLLTSGFASMSIYFRPRHQFGCRFRYLGRDESRRRAHVIAFAQRPGFTDVVGIFTSLFVVGQAHLLYQGFAWIDPETFQIVRMVTDLLAPRRDILLMRATSELSFGEIRFESVQESFWLPQEVVVTMETNGSLFRNRHRYSDYRLFTVGAQDKITPPVIKK